jgi:peptidoglycan/xylan/chitin deacetylase (PgdA/CDA1 family)
MAGPLTIVMYHYVRPIKHSAYPAIRGLELEQFRGQLDYIARFYQPVSVEQVISRIQTGEHLPERAILLQFDDGYRDHLVHVAPELERRGIQATFFPIASGALERRVIIANKVQFILSRARDIDRLIADIEAAIVAFGAGRGLPDLACLRARHFHATRIDTAPAIYVKRLLQVGLPPDLADRIASRLFRRHVTADEKAFADELYMSVADLKALIDAGHQVGCHTDTHPWINSLGRDGQRAEVLAALRLHDALGLARRGFTFCYPYGGYDDTTLAVLEELGCAAAFTAEPALANPSPVTRLKLPRLDTIDLPMEGSASPNPWTRKITVAAS